MAGQPQYFGNFGLQRFVNPAMVLPTAHNGAVSSYLFLKNIPGVRFASPVPQMPQVSDTSVLDEMEKYLHILLFQTEFTSEKSYQLSYIKNLTFSK